MIDITQKRYAALLRKEQELEDYVRATQYMYGFLNETRIQFREASDNGRECDAAYFKGVINGIAQFNRRVVDSYLERTLTVDE